jgi:hypothetical protein
MRKVLSLLLAAGVSLTLTACDPPIPEALLIAAAEREVQCQDGSQTIYAEAGYAELTGSWAELMGGQCETMSIELADSIEDADLVMHSDGAPSCEAHATAPVGFDAGAITFFLDAAIALNLSPEVIAGIFDGTIEFWSDPELAPLNPEIEFEDIPIVVVPEAPQAAIDALRSWITELTGEEPSLSLLEPADGTYWSDSVSLLENGQIGLFPYSEVAYLGALYAGVAYEDSEGVTQVLQPSPQSIYVASTRWKVEKTELGLDSSFDPSLDAQPFPGTGEAGAPYQMVYPVYIDLCGEDNLLQRAIARYVVRLDAQGLMATSTLGPLPEWIRVESAIALGKGLPTVEINPEDLVTD